MKNRKIRFKSTKKFHNQMPEMALIFKTLYLNFCKKNLNQLKQKNSKIS